MNFETNVFEKVRFLHNQQPDSVFKNALIYLNFRMQCCYQFLLCIIFTSFFITVAILDFTLIYSMSHWAGQRSRYSDCLRAGRFGFESRWEARFSAPVRTDPEAQLPLVQWVPGLSRG